MVMFLFYTMFNGTPWGKQSMKKQAEQYLQQKYGDEVEMKEIHYDFDNSFYFNSIYYAVAQLKAEPQIQFRVLKFGEEIVDDYKYAYWSFEVKNEIKQQFEQVTSIMFRLQNDPISHRAENYGAHLPSYHEIKYYIEEPIKPDLRLWLTKNTETQPDMMATILDIVLFLREKDYKLDSITFVLESDDGSESYLLDGSELRKITDQQSLLERLK